MFSKTKEPRDRNNAREVYDAVPDPL